MIKYSEETCKASGSIQQQINMLAKQSGGDWAIKIKSPKWREAVREKLHEKTDSWCDYLAGTCICDEIKPT